MSSSEPQPVQYAGSVPWPLLPSDVKLVEDRCPHCHGSGWEYVDFMAVVCRVCSGAGEALVLETDT
jgi:hypothetical protein